jgi:hypothetical protein
MFNGAMITVCDQAYADPPYVRPPADAISSGNGVVYGGVEDLPGGLAASFATRTDRFTWQTAPTWLAAESQGGGIRYGDLIYLAHVQGGMVQSVDPAIRIDDRVFSRLLANRAYEGLMSPRDTSMSGLSFDYAHHTVPLRIKLDAAPQDTAQPSGSTGYAQYALLGHVENATAAVKGSDGGCIPALTSLGNANPLGLATGSGDVITIVRQPNMHGNHDDVFVFFWPDGTTPSGNNMGTGLFISTAALLRSAPPDVSEAGSFPHGTPSLGPSADLTQVEGGGGPCP